MSNRSDESVDSDKPAEGSSEATSNLLKIKAEPMETFSEDEPSGSSQQSPSRSKDIQVEDIIRARSFFEDRRPSITTQVLKNNTVCLWNDSTGQAVVVESHQSTKDALASLSMRDSEAKRMETVSRISSKKEEDRTADEKRLWEFYLNTIAVKAGSSHQERKPVVRQFVTTNRIKKSSRGRSCINPTKVSTEEAQALVYNYFNLTDQQKWEMKEVITEDQPIQPYIAKIKSSEMWDKISTYPYRPRFRTRSATTQPIKTEVPTPAVSPSFSEPVRNRRNHFGMSRFLDTSSSEPSSAPSPVMDTKGQTETRTTNSRSRLDQSKQTLMMQDGVNPVVPPAALVINDVSTSLIPRRTLETVGTPQSGPWRIDPAQMVDRESAQQQAHINRHHCSQSSPVQRSKSTPPRFDEEDLIAFLRDDLAVERQQKEVELKEKLKKSTSKPSTTKKTRTKSLVDRSMSTPSLPLMSALNSGDQINQYNTESIPVKGPDSTRRIIRLDMSLNQALGIAPVDEVVGQLRVQKEAYKKMEANGMVTPAAPLAVTQHIPKDPAPAEQITPAPVTVIQEKKAAPKRKKPTKAELAAAAAAQGLPLEEIAKPKRSPPKKKPAVMQQMSSMELQYSTATMNTPTKPTYQQLPSVSNLLPSSNTPRQQHQNQMVQQQQHHHQNGAQMNNNNMANGYGYSDMDSELRAGTSASTFHNAMRPAQANATQHRSMASMLAPLGGFAQTTTTNSGFGSNGAVGNEANVQNGTSNVGYGTNGQSSSQYNQNNGHYSGFNQYGFEQNANDAGFNSNGQMNNGFNQNTANNSGFVQQQVINSTAKAVPDNSYQYYQQQNAQYSNDQEYPQQIMVKASHSSTNGHYRDYDNSSHNQFHSAEYPPPSVESHLSSQSRDSYAPNSQYSSMPQTPISQHSNNGSLHNSMSVSQDTQFSQTNDQFQRVASTEHHMMTPMLQEHEQNTHIVDPRTANGMVNNPSGNQRAGSFNDTASRAPSNGSSDFQAHRTPSFEGAPSHQSSHQQTQSNRVIQQFPSDNRSNVSYSNVQNLSTTSTCQPVTVVRQSNGSQPVHNVQQNAHNQQFTQNRPNVPQNGQNSSGNLQQAYISSESIPATSSQNGKLKEKYSNKLDMPIGEFLASKQHNTMLVDMLDKKCEVGQLPNPTAQQYEQRQIQPNIKLLPQTNNLDRQQNPDRAELAKKKRADYRKRKADIERLKQHIANTEAATAPPANGSIASSSAQGLNNQQAQHQGTSMDTYYSGDPHGYTRTFPKNDSTVASNGHPNMSSAMINTTRGSTVINTIGGVTPPAAINQRSNVNVPQQIPKGRKPMAQSVPKEHQMQYQVMRGQQSNQQQQQPIQQQVFNNQPRGFQQQVPQQEQLQQNGHNLNQPQPILSVPNQSFARQQSFPDRNGGIVPNPTAHANGNRHQPYQIPNQFEVKSKARTKKKDIVEQEVPNDQVRYKLIKVHKGKRLSRAQLQMLEELNVPEKEQRLIMTKEFEKTMAEAQKLENGGQVQHQSMQEPVTKHVERLTQQILMQHKPIQDPNQERRQGQSQQPVQNNGETQRQPIQQQQQIQQKEPMQKNTTMQKEPNMRPANGTSHHIPGEYTVTYQVVQTKSKEPPSIQQQPPIQQQQFNQQVHQQQQHMAQPVGNQKIRQLLQKKAPNAPQVQPQMQQKTMELQLTMQTQQNEQQPYHPSWGKLPEQQGMLSPQPTKQNVAQQNPMQHQQQTSQHQQQQTVSSPPLALQKQQPAHPDVHTDQVTVRYVSPPAHQHRKVVLQIAPPVMQQDSSKKKPKTNAPGAQLLNEFPLKPSVPQAQPQKRSNPKKKVPSPVNKQQEAYYAVPPAMSPQIPSQYPVEAQNSTGNAQKSVVAGQHSFDRTVNDVIRTVPNVPTDVLFESSERKSPIELEGKVQSILDKYTQHFQREQQKERKHVVRKVASAPVPVENKQPTMSNPVLVSQQKMTEPPKEAMRTEPIQPSNEIQTPRDTVTQAQVQPQNEVKQLNEFQTPKETLSPNEVQPQNATEPSTAAPPPSAIQPPMGMKQSMEIQQPVGIQQPIEVQQPIAIQQPREVQQPIGIQQPIAVQQPIAIQQPIGIQQPIVSQQPIAIQQPIVAQQPTEIQQPIGIQQPIAFQQPHEVPQPEQAPPPKKARKQSRPPKQVTPPNEVEMQESVVRETSENTVQEIGDVRKIRMNKNKHIHEIINMVASPQSAMTEEEFNQNENLVKEYGDFFNFTAELLGDLMEDDLYVPELQLLDVLIHPELEPALHGRFRKRFDAYKAGKTFDFFFPRRLRNPPPETIRRKKPKTNDAGTTSTQNGTFVQSHPFEDNDLYNQPLSVATGMTSSSVSTSSSQLVTPVNNTSYSHEEKSSGQSPLTAPTGFNSNPNTPRVLASSNLNSPQPSTSYNPPVFGNDPLLEFANNAFPEPIDGKKDFYISEVNRNIKQELIDEDSIYGQPPSIPIPAPPRKEHSLFDPQEIEVHNISDDEEEDVTKMIPSSGLGLDTVNEPSDLYDSVASSSGIQVERPSSAQLMNDYGFSMNAPLFDADPFDLLGDRAEAQDNSRPRSATSNLFDDDTMSNYFDNWGQNDWIPTI